MDYYNYRRRKSSIVQIGNTPLGGEYPVRIQSMTNTSTLDTAASVDQCIRIIQAGADYVRLTAQGVREAENLGEIKRELIARDYTTPLVADIHFNPKAADAAAYTVDKVRIIRGISSIVPALSNNCPIQTKNIPPNCKSSKRGSFHF